MPDEFAFLPRDRIDGGQVCGTRQRKEGRHADGRKRHRFERVASHDGDLGELNLRPRVVLPLHHLGHGGELRLIAPLPRGVEGERRREIVESVGIERLDRADRLVAPIALGRGCRSAEGETGLAETLRGELAVIGNRHGGGSRVERLGRLGVAHGLGGSPLPIGGARDGQWILGGLGRERKALRGRRRVVRESARRSSRRGRRRRPEPRTSRAGRSGRRLQRQVAARRGRGARGRPSSARSTTDPD